MASTRLLIVDGSPLTAWLVTRVVPADVRVTTATTMQDAERQLTDDPPDAVIFNLTPCRIGWRRLVEMCLAHTPPIPFRCSSAVEGSAMHDRGLPCRREDHFAKTIPVGDLKRVITDLIADAERRASHHPAESDV